MPPRSWDLELLWLVGTGVAAADGVDDQLAGSFELGGVTVAEVASDGGEMAAEPVAGQGAGDPA
jgi:hypothetical protein